MTESFEQKCKRMNFGLYEYWQGTKYYMGAKYGDELCFSKYKCSKLYVLVDEPIHSIEKLDKQYHISYESVRSHVRSWLIGIGACTHHGFIFSSMLREYESPDALEVTEWGCAMLEYAEKDLMDQQHKQNLIASLSAPPMKRRMSYAEVTSTAMPAVARRLEYDHDEEAMGAGIVDASAIAPACSPIPPQFALHVNESIWGALAARFCHNVIVDVPGELARIRSMLESPVYWSKDYKCIVRVSPVCEWEVYVNAVGDAEALNDPMSPMLYGGSYKNDMEAALCADYHRLLRGMDTANFSCPKSFRRAINSVFGLVSRRV